MTLKIISISIKLKDFTPTRTLIFLHIIYAYEVKKLIRHAGQSHTIRESCAHSTSLIWCYDTGQLVGKYVILHELSFGK